MTDEIDVRRMEKSPADYARFQRCFARNGSPRDLALVAWQYGDGFTDETQADLAVRASDDEIAAVYATFPVPMTIGGARAMGAQSLDTMTDAAHRGAGLFRTLATSVYARCAAEGLRLVYGFPNGNSAHGFFNRLGWTEVAPVPFVFVALRSRYFARRIPKVGGLLARLPDLPLRRRRAVAAEHAARLRPLDAFGPEADALWAAFSAGVGVAVARDAAYLDWRFLRKPGEDYRMLGYWEGERLVGFVVFTVKEKHGGRVGYVMELLHVPGRTDAGQALLDAAMNRLAADRADVCLAWTFGHSPNHAAYRGAGFRTLPEKLRPIELHFGALVLDEAQRAQIEDPAAWYLSYCDSDTV